MEKIDIIKALLSDNSDSREEVGGSEIKIVILQRGWVFIGRLKQNGSLCTLTDASNIRVWGTTKGLGELASDGPTDATKLDKVNDVSFHILTSVAMIDCDTKIWNKSL
jgi:hypothetical protein